MWVSRWLLSVSGEMVLIKRRQARDEYEHNGSWHEYTVETKHERCVDRIIERQISHLSLELNETALLLLSANTR